MCKGTGAPEMKMYSVFWRYLWGLGGWGTSGTSLCKALC